MALRRVILAEPHGFCAGVKRAVDLVEQALADHGTPLYCYRELVHNRQVVDAFTRRGVVFVDRLEDVPAGARLVFSAHGVAPACVQAAAARGLQVIDATCPFVSVIHSKVRQFVGDGCRVFLVGHRGHDEVNGIWGEAPDQITVVENPAEAEAVRLPDGAAVAVVTQTTLSVSEVDQTIAVLRRRFPQMRALPKTDICYATRNRQAGVLNLVEQADAVLVFGATNSSNTNRLVEVARGAGGRAMLVSAAADLDAFDWQGVETVGVTAGASTPDSFIREILDALVRRGAAEVVRLCLSQENVSFSTIGKPPGGLA